MTKSDLRETVAKAMPDIAAVIDLVLEEAAREAECVVAYGEFQAVMRENISRAIRALKSGNDSRPDIHGPHLADVRASQVGNSG